MFQIKDLLLHEGSNKRDVDGRELAKILSKKVNVGVYRKTNEKD